MASEYVGQLYLLPQRRRYKQTLLKLMSHGMRIRIMPTLDPDFFVMATLYFYFMVTLTILLTTLPF